MEGAAIDLAIVIPVPRAELETYKRMSAECGNAHLRHGALPYSDAISVIPKYSRRQVHHTDEVTAQNVNNCAPSQRPANPSSPPAA